MTIQEIHDFIRFILDKELGGYESPEDIDMALDRASIAAFRQYSAYYAENQTFQDALAPFKKQFVFTPTLSPGGVVTIAADYMRFLSVWTLAYDNTKAANKLTPVQVINDDELAERLNSQLAPVTVSKPVMQWIGKAKFQLYPRVPTTGEVWYLKRPVKPKLSYTRVDRVLNVNLNTSVNLEWAEPELSNVIYRALQFLGVNLSDEKMIQYTQLKMQEP